MCTYIYYMCVRTCMYIQIDFNSDRYTVPVIYIIDGTYGIIHFASVIQLHCACGVKRLSRFNGICDELCSLIVKDIRNSMGELLRD